MNCIYCGSKTAVTNSRHQKRNNQVWRRRQCLKCKATFTTHEGMELTSSIFVEGPQGPKPFVFEVLYSDVLLALQDRPRAFEDAQELSRTIVRELLKSPDKPIFNPKQISLAGAKVLKRFDKRAHLRFVAEHPSLQ